MSLLYLVGQCNRPIEPPSLLSSPQGSHMHLNVHVRALVERGTARPGSSSPWQWGAAAWGAGCRFGGSFQGQEHDRSVNRRHQDRVVAAQGVLPKHASQTLVIDQRRNTRKRFIVNIMTSPRSRQCSRKVRIRTAAMRKHPRMAARFGSPGATTGHGRSSFERERLVVPSPGPTGAVGVVVLE
jgi:hypothetical protein